MNTPLNHTLPATLDEGRTYLLRSRAAGPRRTYWKMVRFLGYSPCPAVVIVKNGSNKPMRILREDLFNL